MIDAIISGIRELYSDNCTPTSVGERSEKRVRRPALEIEAKKSRGVWFVFLVAEGSRTRTIHRHMWSTMANTACH